MVDALTIGEETLGASPPALQGLWVGKRESWCSRVEDRRSSHSQQYRNAEDLAPVCAIEAVFARWTFYFVRCNNARCAHYYYDYYEKGAALAPRMTRTTPAGRPRGGVIG